MARGKGGLPHFRLGCCAMPGKVTSVPMRTILHTLVEVGNFELVEFTEKLLVEREVEEWPRVDCLIAFYSRGYPLKKVTAYIERTNPIVLNDVAMQYILRNRRLVFARLEDANIPTPRHIVVDHEAVRRGEVTLEEHQDFFVYNGRRMDKPFVEKPEDADNHNNYVYYPTNAGGGCKKLFRKLANRSSEYYSDICQIRRDGVYIYEEFLPTLGTDIKVYTVGPMFAHAEARKSPTLDGRVQRTENGKEERYPVLLTDEEKWISYQVVEVFKQTVCGFDILRTTSGKAVVCDVNGWSFVKGNPKYYLDCAYILSSMFLNAMRRRRGWSLSQTPSIAAMASRSVSHSALDRPRLTSCILDEINREDLTVGVPSFDFSSSECEDNSKSLDDEDFEDSEELQTIVVVMRHGDRSPKQKMKFLTSSQAILDFFKIHQNRDGGQWRVVKLRTSLDLIQFQKVNDSVLQNEELSESARKHHLQVSSLLSTKDFIEITRKVQLVIPKDCKFADDTKLPSELVVVVKWGGELTSLGLETSENLGHYLRERLYPGEKDGLLRLHSTFRHDFKIYTSDEGRCQLTAAAFTKGFLDLDGDLPPILVQMVARDARAQQLFDEGEYTRTVKTCKQFIQTVVHTDLAPEETCAKFFQSKFGVDCPICSRGGLLTPTEELSVTPVAQSAHASTRASSSRFGPSEANDETTVTETTGGGIKSSDSKSLTETAPRDLVWQRLLGEYHRALAQIGPIRSRCAEIHKSIMKMVDSLQICLGEMAMREADLTEELQKTRKGLTGIHARWQALGNAWWKDERDLPIDATKIPEVYDNARYDLLHGHSHLHYAQADRYCQRILQGMEVLGPMVSAWEFGVTPEEKVEIGCKTVPKLIRKIADDLLFQHKRSLELQDQERSSIPNSIKWSKSKQAARRPASDDNISMIIPTSPIPGREITLEADSLMRQTNTTSGSSVGGTRETVLGGTDMSADPQTDTNLTEDGDHIILKQAEARRMGIKSPWRKVRSRYYAASASHLMSLLNVLTYADFSSRRFKHHRDNSDASELSWRLESPERFSPAIGVLAPDRTEVAHLGHSSIKIPPLFISASDTPYLSHLCIRVWRPSGTGKQSDINLNEMRVELGWNTGPKAGDAQAASIGCNIPELCSLLRRCMVDDGGCGSASIASSAPHAVPSDT